MNEITAANNQRCSKVQGESEVSNRGIKRTAVDYVSEGNRLLKRRKVSEANNELDQAIKEHPYCSIAHYNKRMANELEEKDYNRLIKELEDVDLAKQDHPNFVVNTASVPEREFSEKSVDVDLTKQDHPNFVVNIIAYVPEREFSDDSSDEEEDELFVAKYNNYSFPYTTTKLTTSNKKVSKPKAEWQIIEPDFSHATQGTADSVVVDPLLSKIEENGFEVHEKDKLSTIAVSVGLNRMYSLSKRKNNSLILELKSKVNTREIRCEKFGFFWKCAWYTKDGEEANFENVRTFYKQLKRKDPDLAQKFITQEESETAGSYVPYRYIREYAKNHHKTKELIKEFRDNNSTALIYLHLVDADVYDFNGVYSAYLRIIQGCYEPPTIMSTGYEFPEDTQKMAHHLLGHMERMYRVVTSFYIPLGTYYPEPNMCILILQNCETVGESFIEDTRKRRKGNTLESPILLSNIQNNRLNVRAIFSEDKAIIIIIPSRAKVSKKTKQPIPFSPEFNEGPAGPTSRDIKLYNEVSQSHTDNFSWAKSLFVNNSMIIINDDNELYAHQQCVKFITKIRKQDLKNVEEQRELVNSIGECDVEKKIKAIKDLEQFEIDLETSQRELVHRIGKVNTNNIVNAIKHLEKFEKYFNNEYKRTPEEQKLLDMVKKLGISYDNLSRKSVLKMVAHNVTDLIEDIEDENEARDVLKKINNLFSEYEEEYSNLTNKHGESLDSIIYWDLEKIECLGSDDLIDVVDRLGEDTFGEIEYIYDRDGNLPCGIVQEILDSTEELTGMDFDFADLVEQYVDIVEHYEMGMYGENIIDVIARAQYDDSDSLRARFVIAKQAGFIDSGCSTPSFSSDEECRRMSLSSDDDNSSSSVGSSNDSGCSTPSTSYSDEDRMSSSSDDDNSSSSVGSSNHDF